MTNIPADTASKMTAIAKQVKRALPESMGFILFLELQGNLAYIANADRSDAIATLEEWMAQTETKWVGPPAKSHQLAERSKQEDRCATIGAVMGLAARLALFVFDFGDGGNLSFWSNIERDELRHGIRTWMDSKKS